jgi:hypothetical protein
MLLTLTQLSLAMTCVDVVVDGTACKQVDHLHTATLCIALIHHTLLQVSKEPYAMWDVSYDDLLGAGSVANVGFVNDGLGDSSGGHAGPSATVYSR